MESLQQVDDLEIGDVKLSPIERQFLTESLQLKQGIILGELSGISSLLESLLEFKSTSKDSIKELELAITNKEAELEIINSLAYKFSIKL